MRRPRTRGGWGAAGTALLVAGWAGAGCKPKGSPVPATLASGGAAASPAIRFEDVAAQRGVTFKHYTGADGRYYMPESVGSGGGFFDYDGDGWLDLVLINSSNWPDRPAAGKTLALYRNQGDGSFRDVTKEAGLAVPLYGLGCAVGDYDGDGHDDLLVTGLGVRRLFRNTGQGSFRDVTTASGLADPEKWNYYTSAAWLDYDRDGRLDLFMGNYVEWSPQKDVPCRSGLGKRNYCGPNLYKPMRSALWRNVGNGTFRDVSRQTGIAAAKGKALGVLPLDENGDGWLDLLVTNDTTPNHLFRSEAGKKFREVGQEAGIAVDDTGKARAGMGIDVADVRNDGGLAFGIGNFTQEGLSLYSRMGDLFADAASSSGLVPASIHNVTFGLTFLDADRDGWQDLFAYNGHVDPEAAETGGPTLYRQYPQLFQNNRGSFTEVGQTAGEAFKQGQVGRGCAWGDFDNDGRPDLLLCENSGPARLLHNVTPDQHHWLGVKLKGAGGNRNAYGAEVKVTAGGITQRRWVRSGGSYLSHSDTRALFGLGPADAITRLEVRWPTGKTTIQEQTPLDRYIEIEEPAGE